MTVLLSTFVLAASTFALPPPSLSTPAACSSAPAPVERATLDLDGGGEGLNADCTAYCGSNPPVSCSASTCSAVDQNCSAGQRGYVTCGSTTYYCPPCPCTEGSFRTITVGPTCGCEDGASTPKERQQCVNGQWEYYSSFCGAPFCPIYP